MTSSLPAPAVGGGAKRVVAFQLPISRSAVARCGLSDNADVQHIEDCNSKQDEDILRMNKQANFHSKLLVLQG